jgi:prepilin-type N-terminal cleavage/methylation domain-containing protein
MKRAGFTMIELIFVIVILGILAAVAIPKLAATRTDAEVSKAASDLATVITDIGSYYTAQGQFADLSVMTNVVDFDDTAKGDTSSDTANFQVGGNDCVLFTFTADTVTLSDVNETDPACVGLQGAASDLIVAHKFGGTGVTY